MTAAAAALALSRSYLQDLTEEMRPLRRAQVLCAVYARLCTTLHPEVAPELVGRFVAQCCELLAPRLSFDEPTTRALLLDHEPWTGAAEFAELSSPAEEQPWEAAHRLGEALDLLLAVERGGERKSRGSYFTPKAVARTLVERSFRHVPSLPRMQHGQLPRVLDPACGGGAFLVEAVRVIARFLERAEPEPPLVVDRASAVERAVRCAHGIDVSALAIATARAALALLAPSVASEAEYAARFLTGDALLDSRTPQKSGELRRDEPPGFDWVVGNPPWVAFQGRATQPISAELRASYRQRYRSFSGYPTTQGMFAERATELAPHGVIGLLVPSSLADLEGYKATRACVAARHKLSEPLLEFGQDAFEGVVQPCFGLVATPRTLQSEVEPERDLERSWALEERPRLAHVADRVAPPACLTAFATWPRLPKATFGELGFQSNTAVVRELFHRASEPTEIFSVALLEGRCVQEFRQQAPRVFLAPNQQRLAELKVRLRDAETYGKVDFVVRQTAAFTIAARHGGLAFRNSLIAGYAQPDLDADLLVGLLNSALFRCLHVSAQRDARQATFPQVKVAHLRALPAPPSDATRARRVSELSARATQRGGLDEELRSELDRAVFELFGMDAQQAAAVLQYLRSRAPNALCIQSRS